jgi:hypothetical protein
MLKWSVFAFPAAAAGAALLITVFAPRPCTSAPPSQSWEPGETVAWANPTEADRFRKLEGERLSALDRVQSRTDIAQALVRGDLSLDDAADRFQMLNRENPTAISAFRTWYPEATDEELVRRQVIQFVRTLRTQSPADVAAVLPRLEAELTRRFPGTSSDRPGPGAH